MLHTNNEETSQAFVQRLMNEISVDQLKAIVEKVDNGVSIIVFDKDGSVQLTYANSRYYQLFGYTRDQFISELIDPYDRIYPGNRKFVATVMEAIESTHQVISFQYRTIKRDGSVTYISCSSSMSQLGKQKESVLMSILTDVSDIVENENKALLTEQRLNAILQSIDNDTAAFFIHNDISNDREDSFYDKNICKCAGFAKTSME